jgi:phosphatidylglycerol:prolipoprotein diacylglycerol transferase
MMCFPQSLAMIMPGMLRLGPLRLPVYGIFAAAGVVAALWLSQRTAKMAGISAEKLWDAGMVAVASAFVASRLLLVILDFRAFVRFPLVVLALPSLTYGGLLLTAFVVWAWLRWKRLPLLAVLDAWAPCAALLAAILSLGHFVEGTYAGMPTRLPWGVMTPGDTVLGRVHPVQIYAMIAALGMTEFLLLRLRSRSRARKPAGTVAGLALVAGGVTSFLLDMVTQPVESLGSAWLDPSQWVALVAVVAGLVLLATPPGVEDPAHPTVGGNEQILRSDGEMSTKELV